MPDLKTLTSDPEFALLTPAEQARVLHDARMPRPRSVVELPTPAPNPLEPYLAPPPPVRQQAKPATLPAPMRPAASDPEARLAEAEARKPRQPTRKPSPAPVKRPPATPQGKPGREAFREFVKDHSDYWQLPASAREQVMSRYIDLGDAHQVDAVSSPLEAFGRSLADEGANNTLTGHVARAGKRALTGDGSEFQLGNEFYAEGPLAEGAAYLGRTAAQLLDPSNLIPIAKGAQVARAVAPVAGAGLGAAAKAVGLAAAKGAVPGAVSGAVTGAADSSVSQYADTGHVDAGQLAKDTAAGAALGGAFGAALPAAKAMPGGRLNPDLPTVDTTAIAQGARRLAGEEHGTFDPDALVRSLGLKQAMRTLQRDWQDAVNSGDQAVADHLRDQLTRLRDSRVTLENRPPDASSLAPPTNFYNERKYNFASPESRAKFDQLTREAVHEHGLNPKQRIPNAEILRRARELTGDSADDLKYKDLKFGESLSAVEYEAAKNTVDSLKERAVDLERQLNALPGTTPPETRRGREAEQRADQAGVREARIDLAKFMSRLERTPPLEALSAFRKAGLLTGLKTIGRNMGSNLTNQVLEEAVRLPASVLDAGLSMLTGNRRTVLAPTPGKVTEGLRAVRTRGVQEFRETMVHGIPLDQLAALEIPKEVNTGIRPLDTYMNTVFRFQSAQDRLFKAYAYTRSLRDQAELLVRQDGTPPAQRAARVQAIMADPQSVLDRPRAEEMVREAIADAEFATFTNDTLINDKLTAFMGKGKNTAAGQALNFAIDQIMPFKKTPSAVAMRVLEFTTGIAGAPLSVGQQRAAQAIRQRDLAPLVQALTPAEQKAIALGMSRGMVGASLIFMGGLLARQGLLTGTYEPDKKDMYEATGRTPGSIKIAGQWVPIGALSPVGNMLILGATLQRDGYSEQAVTAAGVRTVLDQPFTQGAKEVAEVLKPDAEGVTKAVGKMAGNMAGSWVPTIAAEAAQALDPAGADRATSKVYPQSAIDTIRKRLPVPGGRGALPEKTTALGDPVTVPSGGWAFWAFSGKPAREDSDPVLRELVSRDVKLPKPTTRVRLGSERIDLSETQQRDLWQRQGQRVRQVLQDLLSAPTFRDYSAAEQDDAIEEAIRETRNDVRDQWIDENEDALAGHGSAQEED